MSQGRLGSLPWVKSIVSSNRGKQDRKVSDIARHRPTVIYGGVQGTNSAVRNQAMRRLQAVYPGESGRKSYTSALIPSEREINALAEIPHFEAAFLPPGFDKLHRDEGRRAAAAPAC